LCEALDSTREEPAITAFERLFHERGLPFAIRSDNGVPFASPNALFNLSKLSVWWLRLGIAIERIKPSHPQQNGRHERMHLTLKKEATRPSGFNSLQQQERFDAFLREFNAERPHEALAMKCPAELYTASARAYAGLPELSYPFHDRDVLVTACGRLCLHRKRINISTVLAGQKLGIKEVDEGIWLVSFMHYDLGYCDLEPCNPSTTRSAPGCHPCLRYDLLPMSPGSCKWRIGCLCALGQQQRDFCALKLDRRDPRQGSVRWRHVRHNRLDGTFDSLGDGNTKLCQWRRAYRLGCS
jgi:hypothetical protein